MKAFFRAGAEAAHGSAPAASSKGNPANMRLETASLKGCPCTHTNVNGQGIFRWKGFETRSLEPHTMGGKRQGGGGVEQAGQCVWGGGGGSLGTRGTHDSTGDCLLFSRSVWFGRRLAKWGTRSARTSHN
jgi:hypothetical protein